MGNCEVRAGWAVKVLCGEEFIRERRISRGDQKESQMGRSACAILFSGVNTQHAPYQWLHLTCSVAQAANVFQHTWPKRPRAEASLGSARVPSPTCVCECVGRGDTIWHKTPETSRMNDSSSPPSHHYRHSLVSRGKQLGGTGEMRAPPSRWLQAGLHRKPKWLLGAVVLV